MAFFFATGGQQLERIPVFDLKTLEGQIDESLFSDSS